MKKKLSLLLLLSISFVFSQKLLTAHYPPKNTDFSKEAVASDTKDVYSKISDLSVLLESASRGPIQLQRLSGVLPQFASGSSTQGWTDLKVATVLEVKMEKNLGLINAEGAAATDAIKADDAFVLGVFVNGKLKLTQEFVLQDLLKNRGQFSFSAVLEDLPQGSNTVNLYACVAPKSQDRKHFVLGSFGPKKEDKVTLSVQYSE